MNRVVLTLLLATCSNIALAGFDYACLETCANEGNTFQFCTSKCTVQDLPYTQMPATDPAQANHTLNPATLTRTINEQCLVDCANDGYKKEFCVHRCTL